MSEARPDHQEDRQEIPQEDHQEIRINGETRTVPRSLTVASLLHHLGIERPDQVAVERNKEIVPRSRHADTPVKAGDRLEIVTIVGGG